MSLRVSSLNDRLMDCRITYRMSGEAKLKFLLIPLTAFILAACVSPGPPVYTANNETGFGYSETRIENNRYQIVYRGSGGMRPETVESYALRRAAELTIQNSYEWFRVVNRSIARDSRGGVGLGVGVGGGTYGRHTGVGVGVGGDVGQIGAQDFFTVQIEVLLGKGNVTGDDNIYDAKSILQTVNTSPVPSP